MSEAPPAPEPTDLNGLPFSGDADPAADLVDDLSARLAAAEARVLALQEQAVRAAAEQENVRRRAARDVEQARQFAVERFVKDLLPVTDSLMLAGAQQNADAKSLLEGQQATLRLLEKAFESAGLQALDPTGQPFNPEHHEAMVALPTAEVPPDSIITVVQRGWLLHGRLVRPARVIVAKAP